MTRRSGNRKGWRDSIPAAAIESFRRQFKYIYNVLPRMGGSLFSKGFDQHMTRPLPRGLRFPLRPAARRRITRTRSEMLNKRERFDPLLSLLKRWGATQREPWEELVIEGQVEARWPKREAGRVGVELRYSIKNMTSLLANRHTVDELVVLDSLRRSTACKCMGLIMPELHLPSPVECNPNKIGLDRLRP